MKIAALQMISTPRVAENLDTARRLMERAAANGARLLVLPEYFCHIGHGDRDKLTIAEELGDGPIQRTLAEAARELGAWVIGGTLPIRCEPDGQDGGQRVYNSSLVYAPDGHRAGRYDKIHLFRYSNGQESYDESRVLRAGNEPVALMLTGVAARPLRVGLTVCYDLRFPELYRTLSFTPGAPACDLFAVPSAFTYTTGRVHWELLLRARAIENQAYIVAPAQGGVHENGRRTWGHSMIVDPWGEVRALLPEGEGVAAAEMDLARLDAVRSQLPALGHVRLPLQELARSAQPCPAA